MDSLHKGLVLAAVVLFTVLVGTHVCSANHAIEDARSIAAKASEHGKVLEAAQAEVDALEKDPSADADRLATVRYQFEQERRISDRQMARLLHATDWIEFVASTQVYVYGASLLALVMIGLGWVYWLKARRVAPVLPPTQV